MKSVFKFLCSIVYGFLSTYLVWLLFYWTTPHLMEMGWFWFLICFFFIGTLIYGAFALSASLLSMPIMWLTDGCKIARYPFILFAIMHGISAVILPWSYGVNGFLQVVIALCISVIAILCFSSFVTASFYKKENGK